MIAVCTITIFMVKCSDIYNCKLQCDGYACSSKIMKVNSKNIRVWFDTVDD